QLSVDNPGMELLKGLDNRLGAATGDPPLDRVGLRGLHPELLSVLRLPLGDVRFPKRRVGVEADDVVALEGVRDRCLNLGHRDLPVVPSGAVGLLPHADLEHVAIRDPAPDQRGSVSNSATATPRSVESQSDWVRGRHYL